MIKLDYSRVIEKIQETTSLSKEEIESKIKSKMDQLSGLISKDGAAHIIANELNVKLFEEGRLKLKDVPAGMKSVETLGKITNIFDIREFQRKDDSTGKVVSFVIADETTTMRIVLWNDQTDLVKDMKPGDIILIKNALSKQNNNGSIELHMTSSSELQLNPVNESVGAVAQQQQRQKATRKKIEELSDSDANVELLGTIVQVFEPRFYEICPECNKRAKPKDSDFVCQTHGPVAPAYAYVMNAVIDDGTSTIRTVFFRNQLENLLGMDNASILKFKDSPSDFQTVKDELLGKIVKIIGRTSKNEMFDRLEFVSQLVFANPDPDEEMKKLEEEAKVID